MSKNELIDMWVAALPVPADDMLDLIAETKVPLSLKRSPTGSSGSHVAAPGTAAWPC
jgi:hypothetical protein